MRRLAVISPFYNESKGMLLFLQSLDTVIADLNYLFTIYLIDDGSTDDSVAVIREYASRSNLDLYLISMEFNTGHQTAIYEGIKKALEAKYDSYIILDSDGQDDPSIIPALLGHTGYDVVWVKRSSRVDSLYFQVGYVMYQTIYRLITGKKIDFGNYSMISHTTARYLFVTKFVHYPTALLKSPLSRSFVKAKRLARLYGKSKMTTQALVHHAFLSFVEDAEIVVNFFLKCAIVILFIFLISIGNVLYQKYITHTAILGWASVTSIGLLNLVFLSFGLFAISLSILKMGKPNTSEYLVKQEKLTKLS